MLIANQVSAFDTKWRGNSASSDARTSGGASYVCRYCIMSKFMNAGAVELRAALASCRAAFLGVGVFSGLINLLALTSSIYMLQLYDRVIPSHSVPTLVGLTVLMLLLFAGYGVLDTVRTRVMSHIGLRIDRALRARVFELRTAPTFEGQEQRQPAASS